MLTPKSDSTTQQNLQVMSKANLLHNQNPNTPTQSLIQLNFQSLHHQEDLTGLPSQENSWNLHTLASLTPVAQDICSHKQP